MESYDILQLSAANFSPPTLGQQQGNLFASNFLQPFEINLNQPVSFSNQIEARITDVEIKPVEYDQHSHGSGLGATSSDVAPITNSELLTSSDYSDPLTGDFTSVSSEAVLDLAIATTKEQLESFATDAEFVDKMNLAFGKNWQPQAAEALIQELASKEAMPEIEILPAANLKADGAFGEGTVYLSEEFLSENAANPEAVAGVLLEEIGHYVDQQLNSVDSPGDEGDIFTRLVQGENIIGAELTALKAEDDSATIALNGQEIAVELADSPYPGYLLQYEPGENVTYDENVEQWQQRMNDRGWEIDVDGLYGPQSASIARQFQQAKDLAVDGIVGPETWEASFDTSTPPFPGNLFRYESGETLTYDANVEQWQQRMKDLGKDIDVDGLYGPQSAQAARDFQAEQGLSIDGIVGPQTWEAAFDSETPPAEETPPPPPPLPSPEEPTSSFRESVVAIARQEWEDFAQGALQEDDPEAVQQIEEYFQSFGGDYTGQAWSAAFISWVMGEAGAGEEFNYSQLHADYINQAIADQGSDAAFIGYPIDAYSLQPGDLIGANRLDENGPNDSDVIVTYDTAVDTGGYSSHVDVVVATRPEEGEIDVIGGNVSDSVSLETYTIDSEGKLVNPDDGVASDDFFVVIENRFGEDTPPPTPEPPAPPPEGIEFGDYDPVAAAPEFVTDEFLGKVFDISQRLEAVPEYLMAVMGFESAGTYDPGIVNEDSGATGLIQFLPSTAESLGTTTTELAALSAVEQLDYVEQYFSSYTGRLTSLEDTYLSVLYPAAIGEDEVFVAGTEEYEQNQGLDTNEDGVVTAAEAANNVRERLPGSELFAEYRDPATA